jgi:hypothetical protein
MGGFGAMSYAARHPDLFAAAASFSGAVDIATPRGSQPSVVGVEPWGPWNGPEIAWRGHNPYDLAENLRGVGLQIYTGEGDGSPNDIEPTIHAQSASLAGRLAALGIPHTYDDYGKGGHSPDLWTRDLQQTLPWLASTFAHPADLPARWSFKATEQQWSVRGYTLRAARDRLAWRTLGGVQAGGFAVSTDGPTTVTTARRYVRKARYRVVVRPASGSVRTTTARSSADGRLTIAVPGSAFVGITRVTASS